MYVHSNIYIYIHIGHAQLQAVAADPGAVPQDQALRFNR